MSSDMTKAQKLIKAKIDAIAAGISGARVGLVVHKPETWAEPHRCFENAEKKAKRDGGQVAFGWTFHHRLVADIHGPGYLFMSHHAVWWPPDGRPVDVTPHPDAKHRPYGTQDDIVFMFDRAALPVSAHNRIGPLPLQFFALDSNNPELIEHVGNLTAKEEQTWQKLYQGAAASSEATSPAKAD